MEPQVHDDAVTIAIARPPQRRREPPLIPTHSHPCTRFPDHPDDVFTVTSRRPPRREPPLRNNMTLPYLRSPPESPCTSHHDNIVVVIRPHPALTVIVRLARRHRLLPLLHLLRFSLPFPFLSSRPMKTTMTRLSLSHLLIALVPFAVALPSPLPSSLPTTTTTRCRKHLHPNRDRVDFFV